MNRRAGKVSVVQLCLLAGIGLAVYYAYVYGPTKLRYMGMSRICDDVAHKMVVNLQDEALIEEVQQRAKDEQGIELSLSQIQITRQANPVIVDSCRVQWDDKIQPVWQKQPTILHQVVLEKTTPNADLIHEHNAK